MLSLWLEPNPVPVITTDVPIGPEEGETPVTVDASIRVNCAELLVIPPDVTETGPLVAPVGTVTVILVLLQDLMDALKLLNWTVPWDPPNPLPLMIMEPPTGPLGGARFEITGL